MKHDVQLKLQTYLDGELSPAEAKVVADSLGGDVPARELLTELTNTRAAIVAHAEEIKVPATREFYWSGIQREIERQERSSTTRKSGPSIFDRLRHMLVPAGGVAAVVLAGMLAGHQFYSNGGLRDEVETTFEDSGAFTYHDYAAGTTLVWMDYPAENEFAEMDSDDTLEFD